MIFLLKYLENNYFTIIKIRLRTTHLHLFGIIKDADNIYYCTKNQVRGLCVGGDMAILLDTLSDLYGDLKHDITGIRPGEKLHETLINHDEIRYTWDIENMYMLANPHYKLFNDNDIIENYSGITKTDNIDTYSSDISERISKDELKTKIQNLGLD